MRDLVRDWNGIISPEMIGCMGKSLSIEQSILYKIKEYIEDPAHDPDNLISRLQETFVQWQTPLITNHMKVVQEMTGIKSSGGLDSGHTGEAFARLAAAGIFPELPRFDRHLTQAPVITMDIPDIQEKDTLNTIFLSFPIIIDKLAHQLYLTITATPNIIEKRLNEVREEMAQVNDISSRQRSIGGVVSLINESTQRRRQAGVEK